MTEEIEFSFYGTPYSNGCPGCKRIEPQREGLGIVFENEYFRVHPDFALPIPVMMVIESRVHVRNFWEFPAQAQQNFGIVVALIGKAISDATEIAIIDGHWEEKSSHFNAYLLHIYDWMQNLGRTRNLQPIFDYAKQNLCTPENIAEVEKVTKIIMHYLSNSKSS